MGNCLSTCTKSSESAPGHAAEGQSTELDQLAPHEDSQALGGDKVRHLVQQELQALQTQISHSQAVLAKLHFRFEDEPVSLPVSGTPEIATVHRTTQTSNPDTLPKSLECVPVTVQHDWGHITSSCPAIVSTAVQTDDETSKSNGTSGEYFLPPISPLDSQASEPPSPKDTDEFCKPIEPRPLSHIDLDIYRSCRKLSVLPEEEGVPDEVSPPPAPPLGHCPHQAHSFESYLLPVPNHGVRRQLSDPTPSPEIHPASRRSSRSTCRPLQLQPQAQDVFQFPEVQAPKSPPCVTFQNPLEDDFLPRITSPTYNRLQDTVSQLITMSTESLDAQPEVSKKESLTIPPYYAFTPEGSTPFKTPPECSLISTPGFFTPQDFSEKKPFDSSSSSSFQTPSSASPGANNGLEVNKSTSNSSQSYKTPVDGSERTSYQSSFSSPLHLSPKRRPQPNGNNEEAFTEVPDLRHSRNSANLFVKPLPEEFDRSRTMLSILLDEPRVQADNTAAPFISFTSLPLHQPQEVPSTALGPVVPESTPDRLARTPSLSPVGSEGLARTPSRRRLQRSLVRISSETPLELVPVEVSVAAPVADVPVAPAPATATPPILITPQQETNGVAEAAETPPICPLLAAADEDGSTKALLQLNGSSAAAAAVPLSFPSLSDTVLRQLGALMEEVKQKDSLMKEGHQSSEKEVESKFTSLMLAFKTDKLTLERRLELQQRLRDQAETNMATELTRLKAAVQLLSPLCTDSEKIELLEKVSEQVDALHKSTTRVSTSAEMYGAVQQENRLSKAVDIVLRHVENLKQSYDKERIEHEETRRVLTENKVPPSAVLKLQQSKRRASIATVTRTLQPPLDASRSPTLPGESRSLSRSRLGSLPRKLSNTILETDLEDAQPTIDLASSSGGVGEAAENSATHPQPRALARKSSRPTIVEERRVSHTGETESEDELSPLDPSRDIDPSAPPEHSSSFNSPRKPSQQAWWCELSERMDWIGPVDQLCSCLRRGVAVLLLAAALAVFTSTFVLPHTRLAAD